MSRTDGFSDSLVDWYRHHQRQLPWRENKDPYGIWISEIMLQQTQVDTVIPYYQRFMAAFPTVQALAAAEEDAVFKAWEGLGYYSRARNLMRAARMILAAFGGEIPNTRESILKLPGIGPYTAGAILSIAFGQAVPAVDGNVMRVYARLKAMDQDIALPQTRPFFEDAVKADFHQDTSAFTQGLMELGALICTPKNPKCEGCPVCDHCVAFQSNTVQQYPVKSKKAPQTRHRMAVLYCTHGGELLLIKTGGTGLLSGLWGFPVIEEDPKCTVENLIEDHLLEVYAAEVSGIEKGHSAKHVFSHRIWEMTLYRVSLKEKIQIDLPQMVWIPPDHIGRFALSTALKKLL